MVPLDGSPGPPYSVAPTVCGEPQIPAPAPPPNTARVTTPKAATSIAPSAITVTTMPAFGSGLASIRASYDALEAALETGTELTQTAARAACLVELGRFFGPTRPLT